MMRRTHGACVTSVLCARVLVCKAQSSERGRGSGEARCATCLFVRLSFAQEQTFFALGQGVICYHSLSWPHRAKREACIRTFPPRETEIVEWEASWRGDGDAGGDAGGDAAR